MIQLRFELACLIHQQLRDCKSKIDPTYTLFTEEELHTITELRIERMNSIEGIEKLPNLKKLSILNLSQNFLISVNTDLEINRIQDFKYLEKCSNLEYLEISNDVFLKTLDVSKFSKLKTLILTGNRSLKNIIGLEELLSLKMLLCYNNASIYQMNVDKYLKNTRDARVNVLDTTAYPEFAKYYGGGKKFQKVLEEIGTKLMFCENVAQYGPFVYTMKDIIKMEKVAKPILESLNVFQKKSDKIAFLAAYLLATVTFDRNMVIKKNIFTMHHSIEDLTNEEKKKLFSLHSSYRALVLKKANCEGITHLFRFLLSWINVPSFDIYCSIKAKSRFETESNHAMLAITDDTLPVYYDITEAIIDSSNASQYYEFDYLEAKENYNLSLYEKIVYENGGKENEKHLSKTFK